MQKNFTIEAFAVIETADLAVDLHNLYGLTNVTTDRSGQSIQLVFERDGDFLSLSPEMPRRVIFTCSGNLRLAFNDLSLMASPMKGDGVEIALFTWDCGWDEFLDERLAEAGADGLHFMFSEGFVLRIGCAVAEVLLGIREVPA